VDLSFWRLKLFLKIKSTAETNTNYGSNSAKDLGGNGSRIGIGN